MKNNIFNSVEMTRPKTNVFDLTHDVKMSGQMGLLMPVLNLECVPGDRFTLGCDSMVRFAPMLAPIMHRVDLSIHYFFVPNRLLWDGWEDFITNTIDPSGNPRVFPTISLNEALTPVGDYLGVNFGDLRGNNTKVSALPFHAYQTIWNEYYRDQNLQDPYEVELVDGSQPNLSVVQLQTMRKRAWEHDYFTASLPFAQKGAAVDIPLGEVKLKDDWATGGENPAFVDANGVVFTGNIQNKDILGIPQVGPQIPLDSPNAYDPKDTLEVGATTISDLRRAFKLQEWLEKNARGGTRYTESILAHFGVKNQDSRLQRPEYITGTKAPVVISEVLNTTGTSEAPQGDMAGHGIGTTYGKTGNYYCHEHGLIIGIMSIMPRTAYMQGIHKSWTKFDFLDYYFPSFAHIGEQEVKNKEIYATGAAILDEQTFGYVPRYAEYKYMPSRVAGEFKTSLSFWHLARKFNNVPTLSSQFIECDPSEVTRIFPVETSDDNLWMHLLHKIRAVRPMPLYGTPMI